jgi:hypothetical protein
MERYDQVLTENFARDETGIPFLTADYSKKLEFKETPDGISKIVLSDIHYNIEIIHLLDTGRSEYLAVVRICKRQYASMVIVRHHQHNACSAHVHSGIVIYCHSRNW